MLSVLMQRFTTVQEFLLEFFRQAFSLPFRGGDFPVKVSVDYNIRPLGGNK